MPSYISSKTKVKKSKNGFGIFATQYIKKGELIADFSDGMGKYLKTKDADKIYDRGLDYMLQVDDDLFFAATTKKEIEEPDLINHSCNPNCGIKGALKIVAMRNIKKGEEITFDYAMSESSNYKFKCNCDATNCR